MKQYTTPEQTAKLIELGFEKPNVRVDTIISTLNGLRQETLTIINDFSIGELIELLPTHYDTGTIRFELVFSFSVLNGGWIVGGTRYPNDNTYGTELIDALYDMVVKLKEEEVI